MGRKVLFIGSVWPEPQSSAGGARLMQLIRLFKSFGFESHYASAAAPSDFASDLAAVGVEAHPIRLNDESFNLWVKTLAPTIVVYDRFMTEEQFSWRVRTECPNTLHVLETIDLHCLRRARQTALKKNGAWEDYLLEKEDSFREIGAILRSDLTLMISDFEMQVLKNFFQVPTALLFYLPYEVPVSTVDRISYDQKSHFISIGNFKHEPNWDAVLWLKQEIWPLIRRQLPQANLYVCGAYPEEKVWQLNQPADGFLVKGRVEDAQREMGAAKVLLAPLRFGAGIKGKLVESMLVGTPNVTTAVGIEGLGEVDNWNGFVEESPSQIAEAAVRLYNDAELWNEKVSAGDELLKRQFANKYHYESLRERVEEISFNLIEHRRKNFMGSLLNHDLLQRSKYFSKWIEEKEKPRG